MKLDSVTITEGIISSTADGKKVRRSQAGGKNVALPPLRKTVRISGGTHALLRSSLDWSTKNWYSLNLL